MATVIEQSKLINVALSRVPLTPMQMVPDIELDTGYTFTHNHCIPPHNDSPEHNTSRNMDVKKTKKDNFCCWGRSKTTTSGRLKSTLTHKNCDIDIYFCVKTRKHSKHEMH